MMVMTANTKLTRRILLFTDARTTCTDEDQELLIEAVGAMHAEGMRLDVVIPGLAQLPEYDGDDEAWEAPAGEDDGSDGESAAGPSSPAGGGRKPRKYLRGAPADGDGGMDVELAATDGADGGSQENEEEEEQEEDGAVSNPILSRAFAPDDVDAEVRARLEHSAAAGGGTRKTKAQARNETLLRRAAAVTGGMPLSISALTDYLCEPRKRSVRAVAKYAGTLSLSPAVHIPVRAYTATTEVRLPTCKRLSWARTLEVGHHVIAVRHTTFSTPGKPEETLDEEDIMPAYAYGSDIVPVSAEVDATLVRCPSGPKSLRVLGFVPLASIPQVYFLSAVDAVMAMGEVAESRASLAALATAMRRCKRGAIARLVMRDDAVPQLKFLWADELPAGDPSDSEVEDDDGKDGEEAALGRADRQPRPFLYMVSMPLADGIRSYTFPSMQPKLDVLTTQKRDAVDALFDTFDMDAPSTTSGAASTMRDDDDDDAGALGSQNSDPIGGSDAEEGRALDCEAIFNPAIHLFFAATVQRALDGVTGTVLPALPPALGAPLTSAAHVRDAAAAAAAVGRFAELLPTRRVDPRSVRKEREYFAANRDGSKQLLGAFLPDEYGDADSSVLPTGETAATDPPDNAVSPPSAAVAAVESSAEVAVVAVTAGPPSDADAPPSADGSVLPPAAQPIDVLGAPAVPAVTVAATPAREHPPVHPPPPVALAAEVEEASEITAAAPVGRPDPPAVAAAAAATKGAPENSAPGLLGDSDDEEDGGPGRYGNPDDAFDLRAMRTQIEATQQVSDSQAESRLFSYATRTTGGRGAAAGGITDPSPSDGSAAAATPATDGRITAAPPPSAVWAVGEDDPVADFAAMLANADADAQVAAEMLTDCFRSRVRAGDAAGAAAALGALRTGCVTARIGDEFNRAARRLVDAANAASPFLARPVVTFLGHLLRTPAVAGGGLDALRLVTEAEGGGPACAGVTPAIVDDFNRLVAAAAARVVSAPPRPPPTRPS